jgi:Uma2 family endonuclease
MSARVPVQVQATYEDLMKVPDIMVAELVDGELFASPRPRYRHMRVASKLGGALITSFDSDDGGPGGWWILDEPEIHFGRNVLVPDIAGWRHERMPDLPEGHINDIAPDWVCEVTSPSTGLLDRSRKMPIYARAGVSWMWIIDPDPQTLEVFANDGETWRVVVTYGGEDVVRAQPFDAIEIHLSKLWRVHAS